MYRFLHVVFYVTKVAANDVDSPGDSNGRAHSENLVVRRLVLGETRPAVAVRAQNDRACSHDDEHGDDGRCRDRSPSYQRSFEHLRCEDTFSATFMVPSLLDLAQREAGDAKRSGAIRNEQRK